MRIWPVGMMPRTPNMLAGTMLWLAPVSTRACTVTARLAVAPTTVIGTLNRPIFRFPEHIVGFQQLNHCIAGDADFGRNQALFVRVSGKVHK